MGGGGFLGLGPAPSAPAAPNYSAAAQATAQGNLEAARAATAANRVNQVTPYGNLTYTQNSQPTFNSEAYTQALKAYNDARSGYQEQRDEYGNVLNPLAPAPTVEQFTTAANPDGGWEAKVSLSPEQQKILDIQNQASIGLGSTINSALGQVQSTMDKPFTPNTPAIKYGGDSPEFGKFGTGPEFQNLTPAQKMQTVGQAENLARVGEGPQFNQIGQAPELQTNLTSGMAGWDKAQGILNQRLQPQMQLQNEQLDVKLRNQGIMPGTEAYNRAKSTLGMQQNDLINQSQLTAQGIGQNIFNQDLQAGQFGNTALNQMNQNQLANLGFNNQTNQQGYQNQLAQQQANNQAINQQNANMLANTGFNNTSNQQDYSNLQAMLNMNNQNAQQGYQNMNTGTSLNNQTLQQGFANQQAQAALSNQAQQQAFNQQMTQYNMPLNTLSALRSGSQVQNPSFVNPAQQATTQGADLLGAAGMQQNAAMGAFNAQQGAQAGFNSGLMGLAGAGIMASDIRLKENIDHIGYMANGLPLYEYNYIKSMHNHPLAGKGRFIGVMAHEVEQIIPEAVITFANGYKSVNYGLL